MIEPSATLSLEYYRRMLLIRLLEEKVAWLFSRDLVSGTCHLCVGQEACAVGALAAIRPDDLVVSTHRGHGHALAKGCDPRRLMAELTGKSPGYCRGKGGTQHLSVMEIGFVGTNGITGGGIPIATGLGLAAAYRKTGQVVLSFFGDGASNQGTFHESLNMAALWKLPVVYVCENNGYAMSTPASRGVAVKDIAVRAASYGMPGSVVDGMDLLAVREAVAGAAESARAGRGPSLIEAKTYRFSGHSKSDRRVYRTRQEEHEWEARDPIRRWKEWMLGHGVAAGSIDAIEKSAGASIDDAATFAAEADDVPASEALNGAYVL